MISALKHQWLDTDRYCKYHKFKLHVKADEPIIALPITATPATEEGQRVYEQLIRDMGRTVAGKAVEFPALYGRDLMAVEATKCESQRSRP